MAKLLIVEESTILCALFKKLLDQDNGFSYEIAQTYEEAKSFLQKSRYEFSVVSRTLSDAKNGEVIALLNKHNVAPIVYASSIDEDFIESFEGANIVEYILRHKYDNVGYVISRLNKLKVNKQKTVLVVHKSEIYRRYVKQNLALHHFKVILVSNAHEAIKKLELHQDICLVLVNKELMQINNLKEMDGIQLVRHIRTMRLDNVNIIALASESNSYETSLFLNEGADDYLINQYSRDEFYIRIYQNLK